MSMNMSGGDSGPPETYADLEVEAFEFNHEKAGFSSGSGTNSYVTLNVEPLSQSGGLDHNEVAEVVGIELNTGLQLEYADKGDGSGATLDNFQVRPGSVQMRGYFGVNLGQQEIVNGFDGSPEIGEPTSQRNAGPNTTSDGQVYVSEEPGILASYVHDYTDAFFDSSDAATDDTQGPYAAGPSTGNGTEIRKYYPEMGIRGPVIDENDDIGVGNAIIDENTSAGVEKEGVIQVRLMYRLHEIEGVRNDFSLP
jgi:hypothetical protein